jgi:hypothetical protein
MLPNGMLPNYHPFCQIFLLWLVIALELFVHVLVECVLWYWRWPIFMSSVLTLNFASDKGKCLQRLMKWWKTFMMISAWAVCVVMNGLSDLRIVGSQHMMSRVWRSTQHRVQVHEIIRSNCRLTVGEIAEECDISRWSYHDILRQN